MTEEYRESVPVLTFPRQTLVSLLVFAVVWEVLSHLAPYLGIPPFAIPSFVRIARSITTITPIDIVVTLARVIAALVVSFVLGLALAMAMMHKVEDVIGADRGWLGQRFSSDEMHFVCPWHG